MFLTKKVGFEFQVSGFRFWVLPLIVVESIWQGNAIFCCCKEATNGSLFTAYKKRVDQEILERKAGLGSNTSDQCSVVFK